MHLPKIFKTQIRWRGHVYLIPISSFPLFTAYSLIFNSIQFLTWPHKSGGGESIMFIHFLYVNNRKIIAAPKVWGGGGQAITYLVALSVSM